MLDFEFFDRARQFRRAYEKLRKGGAGEPPEWPKYLLFFHAMELALKAYLIRQGVSENVLSVPPFGHNLKNLVDDAVNRGLLLPYGCADMIAGLGGAPGGEDIAPHLRIRYPLDAKVYSLGQFDPYMDQLFTAVASALGVSP